MAAPVDFLVANSFFGLAKETTWNTPITTPTFFVPFLGPKWAPKVKWLPDTSMVGSPVMTRDLVPGKRYDEYTMKHNLYMDSIGNQLVGILGNDVISGTAAPFTHTIKLVNNQTGSQPPSYTLQYFDSSQQRQIAGSRLASLDFSWSADGGVEVTDTWLGAPETDVATGANTSTTASFVPGWDIQLKIATIVSSIMVSGSLNITRGTAAIFTSDSAPGPHLIFTGPIQVKGKCKFLIETGAFNPFTGGALVRNQQAVVLTFTEPVSAATLALTMTNCQFQNPSTDPGQKWMQVDVEFESVSDTTDASSGISPLAAILSNSQATAY